MRAVCEAMAALGATCPADLTPQLMGHASIQTTQKYLDHLDLADLGAWAALLPGK